MDEDSTPKSFKSRILAVSCRITGRSISTTAITPNTPTVLLSSATLPIIEEYASLRAPPTIGTAELSASFMPLEVSVSALPASRLLSPRTAENAAAAKDRTPIASFLSSRRAS